ncbi:MAG TPA: RNA polymerase sigma factor [Thermoanaerobaculia bacterium]
MHLPLLLHELTMPASRDVESTLAVMDEDEFRAFYERTSRPLWSYLSRITGDPHQADDALQEAYYRFYRAGAKHENEAHRRNSLFQIATNLVRDAARRAKHHTDVPLESDDESPADVPVSTAPLPEQQAAIRTDLSRAMGKLEPMQREMLWLAYAQGASHEEIADILGLKTVSIRTMLLRARRKLAGMLTAGPKLGSHEARR